MACEMGAGERITLAISLFLNIRKLHDELTERKDINAEVMEVTIEFFQSCTELHSWLAISRASARSVVLPLVVVDDWRSVDSVVASSLKANVTTLIDSRSKWVSMISRILKMNSKVAPTQPPYG